MIEKKYCVHLVYYKGKKQLKNVPKNAVVFEDTFGLATNFIVYCMENIVYFDTHDFFSKKTMYYSNTTSY
jgi:hypothetical protein